MQHWISLHSILNIASAHLQVVEFIKANTGSIMDSVTDSHAELKRFNTDLAMFAD